MKNPNVNWSGYLTFAACFAFATVFFVYIIIVQPGPVDGTYKDLPEGITSEDNIKRKQAWFASTPEAISRGEVVFSTNCLYCHSPAGENSVLNKVKSSSLKYGAKEIDLFRTITRGMQGQHRFEYLLENDRWALVHYLRSLNKDLPSSSSSEFKKYLKEGI